MPTDDHPPRDPGDTRPEHFISVPPGDEPATLRQAREAHSHAILQELARHRAAQERLLLTIAEAIRTAGPAHVLAVIDSLGHDGLEQTTTKLHGLTRY
jgi:hypothetical protein